MTRIDAILVDLAPGLAAQTDVAPHLNALITLAKDHTLPFRLLLNNSWHDEQTVLQNWTAAGAQLQADHIQLPAPYLAHTLSHQTPRATVFALTTDHVKRQLGQAGLRVIDNPEEIGYLCDYVVTGAFPGYSYKHIISALRCREMGAQFVALEREPVYEQQGQMFPAGGPTAAAVQTVYGQPPQFVAAMPNPGRVLYALQRDEITPEHALLLTTRADFPEDFSVSTRIKVVAITPSTTPWSDALHYIGRKLAERQP